MHKFPMTFKPSPNFDFRSEHERKLDAIVLSHTASNNGLMEIARMRDPDSGVSAHYVVDRDGSIYQLVKDKDRAWLSALCMTCEKQAHEKLADLDEHSIGIALVNDGGFTRYTTPQNRALEELVKHLLATHPGLPGVVTCHEHMEHAPSLELSRIRQVAGSLKADGHGRLGIPPVRDGQGVSTLSGFSRNVGRFLRRMDPAREVLQPLEVAALSRGPR